ncbi:hypothetical protein A2Z22_01855 [Candidatus Woesebacteria bacterium RBG_16_34_12]|uniref:Uncharacterized protein n=1 Tax=Candidatus Woesebacteria bacterium RBG_16_34_12 TaxID=1802480 RepID=A0A1F7XAK7_9BACT|nr:MAG: hypothetical protein A2Z22_01855 [Candidatus Woesebacteria bacterium RBG_16_34_12]
MRDWLYISIWLGSLVLAGYLGISYSPTVAIATIVIKDIFIFIFALLIWKKYIGLWEQHNDSLSSLLFVSYVVDSTAIAWYLRNGILIILADICLLLLILIWERREFLKRLMRR